jgi:very-short-patch-repair endonuclease
MLLDSGMSESGSKVAVARVAARQWGRVGWSQLMALGVPDSTVSDWVHRTGYLHPRLPRVYAVGHAATSVEAELVEALLYAGPGAMLSHATAASWLGLLDERPHQIHVSTPRQCRSLPRIRVHRRRGCERVWHNGLPTTTLPQTVVDFSAEAPLWSVRRVLAQADYRGVLDIAAIDAAAGRSRRRGATLRTALQRHRPELAHTKSYLERLFLEICESQVWPLPEVNQYVAGWQVDALWRDKRIAVELDGHGNHHTPAQLRRDRRKELALRGAGVIPVRYSGEQLEERTEVIADLTRLRNGA